MPDPAPCPTAPDDGQPGERARLAALLRGRRPPPPGLLQVDLGDDCAVLADGTAITTDAMVEGLHWDHRRDPAALGWRLVAVNVSDLGAMGARPAWALLSLSLPAATPAAWLEAFAAGLHAALDHFGLCLIGGDTTGSPGPIALSLTVGGKAARPITRASGQPGDDLWVSGPLGASAAEFYEIGPKPPRLDPPVGLGVALAERGLVHAMMDLSDGLRADLARLCAASRCGAWVEPAALPAAPALAGVADPLPFLVAWGEDYELLFAADPLHRDAIAALHPAARRIGALTADPALVLRGHAWPAPLFSHFPAAP